MIVLDAGALIALLDDEDSHHGWALQMFIDAVAVHLALTSDSRLATTDRVLGHVALDLPLRVLQPG